MATAVRTDVHREGVLVPEHYRFVEVLDLYAGTSKDDVATKVSVASVPSRWTRFVEKMQAKVARYRKHAIGDRPALAQCNICGAHIRYAVVWSYFPDAAFAGFVTTGLDCAASMNSAQMSEIAAQAGALREFVAGMRRAAKEAEAAAAGVPAEASTRWSAIEIKRKQWILESDDHTAVAYYLHRLSQSHTEQGCEGCFHCSVTRQLVEEGWLSPLQVESVLRSVRRYASTGRDPEPKVTIPSGVARVVGKVTSVKVRGGQNKALLNCGQYRVYFTVPAVSGSLVVLGAELSLVAKLECSSGDGSFLLAEDVRDIERIG